MKSKSNIFRIFLGVCILSLFAMSVVGADWIGASGNPDIPYNSSELGLQEGVEYVKDGVNGIQTEESLGDYIQKVVIYLLTFVSIIAVVYVIWAGFMILTGNGDDEKLSKARKTIVYVLIGIIVMWLAWPITRWMIDIFNR